MLKANDRSKIYVLIFLISFIFCLLSPSLSFAAQKSSKEKKDPKSIEASAKYNYYLGEYYYGLGRYDDAELYFQKSRDLIESKNKMLVKKNKEKKVPEVEAPVSGGTEYLISDGDILFVSVWQNEDLNQEVVVRPDGKVSFPLVGDLQAGGLSITQLDNELTKRLKEFVKFPEVTISIRRFGGSKVIMLGQVGHPGVIAVSGKKTILEAIALSGGFGPDAVAKSVILIRGGFTNPKARRLNLVRAMLGVNMADNISLQSEDIIFVPKSFISNLNEAASKIMDLASRGSMTYNILDTVGGR